MRLTEMGPDDRYRAWARNGALINEARVSHETIRRTLAPHFVSKQAAEEIVGFLTDVYCPACLTVDQKTDAYRLMPLLVKEEPHPLADSGTLLTMVCLSCGFVEHHNHKKPKHEEKFDQMREMEQHYQAMQRSMAVQIDRSMGQSIRNYRNSVDQKKYSL